MAEPKYLKGACEHCRGHIEFPPGALGTKVSCPHCGQETALRDPALALLLKAACHSCEGRIEFPAEAAGSLASCPHCGTETELTLVGASVPARRKMRSGWRIAGAAGALVFLLLGLIAGFTRLGRGSGEEVELRRFELQPVRGVEPAVVAGQIVNHTQVRFYSVSVVFELLDKGGKPVGDAAEYLAILEPKDSWDFKAVISRPDAASVRLVKIVKER